MRKQISYKNSPPPPAKINIPNIPNQTPSFLGTMVQGMALGAGSSIGHKMVDSVFSGKQESNNQSKGEPNNTNLCSNLDNYVIDFNKCMVMNENNYQECYPLLDTYMKCKKV